MFYRNQTCTIKEICLPASGCIACLGELSFLGNNAGYKYYTCSRCKTVQINPIPNQHDTEQAYTQSQFATHAHGQGDPVAIYRSSRPYYLNIAQALVAHDVSGLVVDYGAGWGGLCKVLIEQGFECKGVELSENMVNECKKQMLPVKQESLSDLIKEGSKAQAITLCGVFEHLSDPKTFLQNAYDLLDNGGLLVSMQPTATFARYFAAVSRLGQTKKTLSNLFWIFDAPWHIALYSIEGMKQLTDQCGFDLLEVRFSPQGRIEGFYGLVQRMLQQINNIGWRIFKGKWPLLISHTFVFKKRTN